MQDNHVSLNFERLNVKIVIENITKDKVTLHVYSENQFGLIVKDWMIQELRKGDECNLESIYYLTQTDKS